jgi:polyhydroxybutyrate depolymerase
MVGMMRRRTVTWLWLAFAGCGAETGGADAAAGDATAGPMDDGGASDAGPDGGSDPPPPCEPGARTGDAGGADGLRTPAGVDFNVRTPSDYDATIGHPLVVVYSPAGVTDPAQTEAFTALTDEATSRGYLAAYVNHIRPNEAAALRDAAEVAGLVAARWCVDAGRVFFTGHSDGGSTATILALNDVGLAPAAIAPSAAGVNAMVLSTVECPAATPVMVLHSENDTLFPGFGAEAADWWAACNGCGALGEPRDDGCRSYDGCDAAGETMYCEGDGGHGSWPPLNGAMLDFFAAQPSRAP